MVNQKQSATVASYRCRVIAHSWINARYRHLRLDAATDLAAITRPGQFYQLKCPQTAELQPFLLRPMSVYGVGPEPQNIEFLYNVTGLGTRALAQLLPGAEMEIVGPLGNAFTFDSRFKHLVFVARGVGLATMAPLLKRAAQTGIKVTALMSARCADDLMREQFLQELCAVETGLIDVHCVYDSDGSSEVERVEGILRRCIEQQQPEMIYTCGSQRLLLLLQRLLADYPSVGGEVAVEQQMACGMGVCLSCVRPFRTLDGATAMLRVCREGPVFAIRDVVGEVNFD